MVASGDKASRRTVVRPHIRPQLQVMRLQLLHREIYRCLLVYVVRVLYVSRRADHAKKVVVRQRSYFDVHVVTDRLCHDLS